MPDEDFAPLAARIMDAVERQIAAVERIAEGLRLAPADPGEAERAGRALASLSRTLVQLKVLAAAKDGPSDDDDALPPNLDDLREELSRRLAGILADGADAVDRDAADRSGD